MEGITGLVTAAGALIAACVGVWNAWQAFRNHTEIQSVKHALSAHGVKFEGEGDTSYPHESPPRRAY